MNEFPTMFPTAAIMKVVEKIRGMEVSKEELFHSLWIILGYALGQVTKKNNDGVMAYDGKEVSEEDLADMLEALVKEQPTALTAPPEMIPIPWLAIVGTIVRLLAKWIF